MIQTPCVKERTANSNDCQAVGRLLSLSQNHGKVCRGWHALLQVTAELLHLRCVRVAPEQQRKMLKHQEMPKIVCVRVCEKPSSSLVSVWVAPVTVNVVGRGLVGFSLMWPSRTEAARHHSQARETH